MRVAIVYDSSTGKTKAAAKAMGEIVRAAGHECSVEAVSTADAADVAAADAICIGSWTKGWFVVRQHPTEETMAFIDRLGRVDGKPAAVFATYALAIGRTLHKMAKPLGDNGADVSGLFKSKGAFAAPEFGAWVESLTPAATS